MSSIEITKEEEKLESLNQEVEFTEISVHGAREHNLKGIDVVIPRDKLTVITGLSGSGKSSLAFDTLYAEGQRRYVETMSPYAKQFLGMMKKPDVDKIEGLSPAISIEQKTLSKNPRSTVGTVTEIYDYIRLLFAKIGIQYSLEANAPVVSRTLDQIVDSILKDYEGMKVQVLAPMVRSRKGHYRELFESFVKQGFTKVRVDGIVQDIREKMQLARYQVHDIELVVDRFKVKKDQMNRITESIELALQKGEGSMMILYESDGVWEEELFSTNYSCPVSGKAYKKLAPNKFSFNSPYGACLRCNGIGSRKDFIWELMIEDKNKSISEGAIKGLEPKDSNWFYKQVTSFCEKIELDVKSPIKDLDSIKLDMLVNGSSDNDIKIDYKFSSGKTVSYDQKFIGIIPTFRHQNQNATKAQSRVFDTMMETFICPDCNGGRLNKESLNVRIYDKNISDIVDYDIDEAYEYFHGLYSQFTERESKIADIIIKEILDRLNFLRNVGLTYLTLGRAARTLSGGEAQRIRLASQIGAQLVGIMYVLDEPSIGLHQHDNNKLIKSLKALRDIGNTLIVVEHDKAMIEEADGFIDIGPGAGVHGGELVLASSFAELKKNGLNGHKSTTAKYLLNELEVEYSAKRRKGNDLFIEIKKASGNNLQNVNLKLPLGKFVCVTGMSGSGKSTLINDTLMPILSRHFYRSSLNPLPYKEIKGLENIDKIIEIDQAPIGRSPRSNPATYTGMFALIRDFFTMLPESKIRGYKPGRFSFNVKIGRCQECEGAGIKKIEMNFLPDVYIECDTCGGKRYNKETLEVKYKHKSIADVLDMTVEEALEFFSEIPKIKNKLSTLYDVGLTYITLGQQAPTLSGGEAQRIKLATELSKRSTGKTLYLLDEPTTGLHFDDIKLLVKIINKLVDKGNTVVVIEHNLDVVKCADWIIDLGPGGGSKGGKIIAEGTPEQIIKKTKSLTGKYLKEELK